MPVVLVTVNTLVEVVAVVKVVVTVPRIVDIMLSISLDTLAAAPAAAIPAALYAIKFRDPFVSFIKVVAVITALDARLWYLRPAIAEAKLLPNSRS
jgi:hypothetical protein